MAASKPGPDSAVPEFEQWTAPETARHAEMMLKQFWNHYQMNFKGVMDIDTGIKLAEAFIYLADVKGRISG